MFSCLSASHGYVISGLKGEKTSQPVNDLSQFTYAVFDDDDNNSMDKYNINELFTLLSTAYLDAVIDSLPT